jgi:clan AA aspartic protease (TIGR02281 family)
MKNHRSYAIMVIFFSLHFFAGCTVAKVTGKVVGATAVLTGKGIKTVVNMASGKHVIQCDKIGNNLVVHTVLNRKVKASLLLDTGCSETQISEDVAKKLGIRTANSNTVFCRLADGRTVAGKEINIKEMKIGTVRVKNIHAIVLGSDQVGQNGLLGMSFLNNFIFKVDSQKAELVLQKRI